MHDHLMLDGCSRRKVFEQVKSLVEEAFHTPRVTVSSIALATSKTFFSKHLLNEDGQGPMEVFKGDKLHQMTNKFFVVSSPDVWNLIVSFKHQLGNKRYVSNILVLKANNGYYYIQDSYFLGQRIRNKMFLFKMFVHGHGSGYYLIK